MRKTWMSVLCASVAISAVSAWAAGPVKVEMKDATGTDVGQVTFTQKGKTVDVKIALKGLPPGEHAIHVHQGSSCTPPDFASAAGHLNPDGKHHGFSNPEGHHAGDFPMSVKVGSDGAGKANYKDADIAVDPAAMNSILGKTVVVHELVDDQKTDPAGASGKRIACGTIPGM